MKVSDIVRLGIGQCSDSKTNVVCGKLARATWFWFDIIVILEFGMPAIDARDSGAVNVEFFSNVIASAKRQTS